MQLESTPLRSRLVSVSLLAHLSFFGLASTIIVLSLPELLKADNSANGYSRCSNLISADRELACPNLTQYFQISIGSNVVDNSPARGAGNLESAGSIDVYRFSAQAGQIVYFDEEFPNSCAETIRFQWEARNPDGSSLFTVQALASCGTTEPGLLLLAQSGTYQIKVFSPNKSTGSYAFRIVELPPPLALEQRLSIGQQVTGSINGSTSPQVFTFFAAKNATIYFDSQAPFLCGQNWPQWEVLSPNGQSLFSQRLNTCYDDPGIQILTQTGLHTIRVLSSSSTSRNYSFQLWEVPAPQMFEFQPYYFEPIIHTWWGQTVSDGVPAVGAGNIESPAAEDIYTFYSDGQRTAYFDVHSVSTGACQGNRLQWELFGPDGLAVSDFTAQDLLPCAEPGRIPLTLNGAYTIRVRGVGSHRGTYSFSVWLNPHLPVPSSEIECQIGSNTITDINPSIVTIAECREAGGIVRNCVSPALDDIYSIPPPPIQFSPLSSRPSVLNLEASIGGVLSQYGLQRCDQGGSYRYLDNRHECANFVVDLYDWIRLLIYQNPQHSVIQSAWIALLVSPSIQTGAPHFSGVFVAFRVRDDDRLWIIDPQTLTVVDGDIDGDALVEYYHNHDLRQYGLPSPSEGTSSWLLYDRSTYLRQLNGSRAGGNVDWRLCENLNQVDYLLSAKQCSQPGCINQTKSVTKIAPIIVSNYDYVAVDTGSRIARAEVHLNSRYSALIAETVNYQGSTDHPDASANINHLVVYIDPTTVSTDHSLVDVSVNFRVRWSLGAAAGGHQILQAQSNVQFSANVKSPSTGDNSTRSGEIYLCDGALCTDDRALDFFTNAISLPGNSINSGEAIVSVPVSIDFRSSNPRIELMPSVQTYASAARDEDGSCCHAHSKIELEILSINPSFDGGITLDDGSANGNSICKGPLADLLYYACIDPEAGGS